MAENKKKREEEAARRKAEEEQAAVAAAAQKEQVPAKTCPPAKHVPIPFCILDIRQPSSAFLFSLIQTLVI